MKDLSKNYRINNSTNNCLSIPTEDFGNTGSVFLDRNFRIEKVYL